MITGNEPMQPVVIPGFVYGDGSHEEPSVKGGLTIRQHFAAMALQGLCASGFFTDPRLQKQSESAGGNITIALVIASVDIADKLIVELNKNA